MRYSLFALVSLVLASTSLAQGIADLKLEPAQSTVQVGDLFDVVLVATSQDANLAQIGALDAALVYDPLALTLLSSDSSSAGHAWFFAGFLPEPDGINTDIGDGDALFTALSQITAPAVAPQAPGLHVTKLRFQALAPSAGTPIAFTANLGAFGMTQVLDFNTPGLDITGDISSVATIVIEAPPLTGPFCLGDGTGTPCPCGANGAPGSGCANTAGAMGAQMIALGTASLSNDTFQLQVTGVPGNKPGLVLRGAMQLNGGLGQPAGDGLLCTAGQSARSQVQVTSGGNTTFTNFSGQPFGATSYGVGTVTNYQFWYRDPTGTCSGQGFNFTNAWGVVWLP